MTRTIHTTVFLISILLMYNSCVPKDDKTEVDLIIHNAKIYTVDSLFSIQEAVAIKDGKIVSVGSNIEILNEFTADSILKLKDGNHYLYPGFIDAHCHFYAYGRGAVTVDLKNVKSLQEIISRVEEFSKSNKGDWIIGRGWNEELWSGSKEVNNKRLNELFPNTPIVLSRVDGHSVLANQAALDVAGITLNSEFVGGQVIVKEGKMTGVLVDAASDALRKQAPGLSESAVEKALLYSQDKCFAEGLTTVADAGLSLEVIKIIKKMAGNKLQTRMYVMSNPNRNEIDYFKTNGPIDEPHLKVRSFKLYGDGSLGSRSALLKKSYCGSTEHYGLQADSIENFKKMCETSYDMNFQLNTHCIGDSANALFLNLYGKALKGDKTRRWRIEHAQVVDTNDMHLFQKYKIIPSVQPTHAISDMYMASDRLCYDLSGAYAYKSLLETAGIIAFGTDFPVEDISPLATFFTATQRVNSKGEKFQEQEAISPEEALKAMTISAAYACFMENEIGSIEEGKYADFTLLNLDLINENRLQNAKVLATFVNGNQVYVNAADK